MDHIKHADAETHNYYDGAVQVTEFHFSGNDTINDAEITITGRYPTEGYTVNDISLALISVESGTGIFTIKNSTPQNIETGDRLLVKPGEPYSFETMGRLAIRYIATPAWTIKQSRNIEA
jgi:hypothetical protein